MLNTRIGKVGLLSPHAPDQIHAANARHGHIEQQQVHAATTQLVHDFRPVRGFPDHSNIGRRGYDLLQPASYDCVVICYKNTNHLSRPLSSGKLIETMVPAPGALST
jgi:hypothetical protein